MRSARGGGPKHMSQPAVTRITPSGSGSTSAMKVRLPVPWLVPLGPRWVTRTG